MKTAHKWTLGSISTLIGIIGAAYAFGMWSGIMWVTIDEFEAFKAAQAQIDQKQDEDAARRQRRHDLADYKFYVDKMCEFNQELTIAEEEDFRNIRERLNFIWEGC